MATDLFTPILNDHTRSVRFFNGRLLSGEAMTDEQSGLRVARELLAQAVGDGIARGFDVEVAVGSSTTLSPVLTVGAGVAINRRGEILLLENDTEVKLVRPVQQTQAPDKIFQTCAPPQQGVYVADSGVYLLTVCSIGAANGLAPVSGLGGVRTSCNAKYIVDAVQLRLLELPVDKAILSDPRARNLIAYQCFGVDHLVDFATDPFGTTGPPRTLLDHVRGTTLTDCDVPLALMYWTATGGIQFVDMWSVRRRVARTGASQSFALDEARLAVAEAMVRQFQKQIDDLNGAGALSGTTNGTSYFRYLPAAGLLPLPSGVFRGINYETFFSATTWRGPAFVPDEKLEGLFTAALAYPPIDIESHELIWLYLGVANTRRANELTLPRVQGFVAFVNGYVEYAANARLNLARWNYANYSRI